MTKFLVGKFKAPYRVFEVSERVTERQFRGDIGQRVAGGLGGQRRGTREARIHFDNAKLAVSGNKDKRVQAMREKHKSNIR